MNIKIATTLRLSNQFIPINKERIIDYRFIGSKIDNSNYYKKIFQLLDDYDKIQYDKLVERITNSINCYESDKVLTKEALIKAINDMIYSGYYYRSFNPYEYI